MADPVIPAFSILTILKPLTLVLVTLVSKLLFAAVGIGLAFFALRAGARYVLRALGGFDTTVISTVDKQGHARFIYQKRFVLPSFSLADLKPKKHSRRRRRF